MKTSLLPSLTKTRFLLSLVACLIFSAPLLAQKNAPVAGDAALLTDLLKKDYNTLDPDVRREQLAKDRTIVIGTLKRYLTEGQQINIKSNPNEKVESCFMEYKKAEQELAVYNTKFNKGDPEIKKINELITDSEGNKKDYYEKRCSLDAATFKNLIEVFKTENQYLSYVTDAFHTKYEALNNFQDDQFAEASQESSVQKALPFIGGDLAFEVIIDGLSKFLAERIKEELTVAVIEKVQDYLRNPKENDPLAELKVLLPRTQEYLLSFKASQMVNFPDEIKQYIEDDLKHLPDNLGDLGNTPRIQRLVKQYPELDFALEALEFIPNLSKIKNPVDFFDLLENSRNISRWANETDPVKHNLANTLKLSSMLAHSLTVVDNGELRMAGADFLNAYGSEVPFYLMYVGFLHQQDIKYYQITFKSLDNIILCSDNLLSGSVSSQSKNTIVFSECTTNLMKKFNAYDLTLLKENINFFSKSFNRIGVKAEKIYISAQTIKKARKSGDTLGVDIMYTYIEDIINITEEITGTTDTLISFLLSQSGSYFCMMDKTNVIPSRKTVNEYFDLKDRLSPYLSIARKTNELVYDLQQEKYATAMIKALELTTDLKGAPLTAELELLKKALSVFPDADGLNYIRFKDTLNDLWEAKNWSAVLTEIQNGKPSLTVKHMKKSAEIILEELQQIRTYVDNNNLYYPSDFWDGFNGLLAIVDNIAHEQAFAVEFTKAQDFLKNSSFKKLVLTYYTNHYLDSWVDLVTSEMQQSGFFKPDEVKEVATSMDAYIGSVFDYLLNRDRKKLNNATESFTGTLRKYILRIPVSRDFHLNEQTIKIIHFVNDMAKAENSDDVKSAIEAFALPAGSYSLKRQQKFTFSLNSYPGVLASIETTWTNNKPYNTFSPSFTAPVGLNFCWSAPRGMSHSIFVPVIDVGAFTRMYIGGKSIDTTSSTADSVYFTTLPEFSFMNLFSPGVYYALGFKKTPLSLYAGFQWGPYIREVKKEGDEIKTVNNYNSMRFSVGLVLDIPLWNIHSKSRL